MEDESLFERILTKLFRFWFRIFGSGEAEFVTGPDLNGPLHHALLALMKEHSDRSKIDLVSEQIHLNEIIESHMSINSICALIQIIGENESKELESVFSWRFDIVYPDCFHVWQHNEENYDVDEWILFGERFYRNAGIWLRITDEEPAYPDIHNMGDVKYYSKIMNDNDFSDSFHCRIGDREYVAFEYANPVTDGKNLLASSDEVARSEMILTVFVNLQSLEIEKVKIRSDENTAAGEPVMQMRIGFAALNEDIKVKPPDWLNAEPNGDGQLIVTSNEIYVADFHEWN